MKKRKYKQRNYAYYKDRIQEYCMGNLPQDSKAPAGSVITAGASFRRTSAGSAA